MPGGRYFVAEQPALTARLDDFLQRLGDDLRRQAWHGQVRALLLAGGYGRGEGGVFCESGGGEPQLYNDLEFYLVLTDAGPAAPAQAWMERWSHQGDGELGIEVEFKLLREGPFRSAEPSMFYYDLLAAHQMVDGPRDYAAQVPTELRDASLIPAHEATRLLFNRGSGLFFARVALAASDTRAANGFVERNHAKVKLALGDAVLALNGRYVFSCRARSGRLAEALPRTPPHFTQLQAWHAEGVEFKLHPRHLQPGPTELQRQQEILTAAWRETFLWLEGERLGTRFPQPAAYAHHRGRLFPETSPVRNVALHGRDFLRYRAALPGWLDYPRAALQRALVLLLEGKTGETAHLLGPAGSLPEAEQRYLAWWRRYN